MNPLYCDDAFFRQILGIGMKFNFEEEKEEEEGAELNEEDAEKEMKEIIGKYAVFY